jgi:2-polyprenyl-3-methyl-5-hydroxy-6-metoxy-1,4-benzoquinol methylase
VIDNINLDLLQLPPQARVLDIGTARGDNALSLKTHGYHVSTLEIDPTLVAALKARPESEGLDIREGDATQMPYESHSFDGAIMIEVMEHIPNTEALLSEIARVLKPGGRICIGIPTGYTEQLYWRLHPQYARNATHVHIFSKKRLYQVLRKAGFHVERIEARNFQPAVSWVFHATLRSKSDHTGAIHQHLGIDRALDRVFQSWSRIPGLRNGLFWLDRHVGKSWYVYATTKKDSRF